VSVRRTLVLGLLAAAGLALVLLVHPPARRSGPETARGPRLFRTSAAGIRRIEIDVDARRVAAERTADGWRTDGAPVDDAARDALDDLATLLARLRVVDAFRATELASFGLAPAQGTVTVVTRRGTQRVALGSLNAAGSALYARREGTPRVFQVGTYLLSALDRVAARTGARPAASALSPRDRVVGLADAARAPAEVA
jgi:uncharacterized protein DUF4340